MPCARASADLGLIVTEIALDLRVALRLFMRVAGKEERET
jgi:hypothetical protein